MRSHRSLGFCNSATQSSEGLLGAIAAAPRAAAPRSILLPHPLAFGAGHAWKRRGRKMSKVTMGSKMELQSDSGMYQAQAELNHQCPQCSLLVIVVGYS